MLFNEFLSRPASLYFHCKTMFCCAVPKPNYGWAIFELVEEKDSFSLKLDLLPLLKENRKPISWIYTASDGWVTSRRPFPFYADFTFINGPRIFKKKEFKLNLRSWSWLLGSTWEWDESVPVPLLTIPFSHYVEMGNSSILVKFVYLDYVLCMERKKNKTSDKTLGSFVQFKCLKERFPRSNFRWERKTRG